MAGFVLPAFSPVASIFTNGTYPGVPRLSLPSNLSPHVAKNETYMLLRLPANTDIRDVGSAGGADAVEVPSGSQRVYDVWIVDDIGKGFPNEHRFAMLVKRAGWPVPIP